MGYVAHVGRSEMHTKFMFGKLKERDHYRDVDALTAVCLVQPPVCDICEHTKETFFSQRKATGQHEAANF
jgi:hypothetical protein